MDKKKAQITFAMMRGLKSRMRVPKWYHKALKLSDEVCFYFDGYWVPANSYNTKEYVTAFKGCFYYASQCIEKEKYDKMKIFEDLRRYYPEFLRTQEWLYFKLAVETCIMDAYKNLICNYNATPEQLFLVKPD